MASATLTWTVLLISLFVGVLSHHEDGHDHDHHHHEDLGPNPNFPDGRAPEVPGVEVLIEDHPYMASVHHNDTYLSAGVIVSDRYILLSDINLIRMGNNTDDCFVRTGYSHRDHDGVVYGIEEVYIVDKFALLRTRTPIEFDGTTNSIDIPAQDESYQVNAPAYIVGWGHPARRDVEGEEHTFLKALEVKVELDSVCSNMYSEFIFLNGSMICISGHEGCTGSSPLIQDSKVIGFNDDATGCSEQDLPVLFDSVARVSNEISQRISA